MTIRELLEVSPCCDTVEIVIRKNGHGQWLQGYRISKDAKIYPSEQTREFIELRGLKEYRAYSLKENEIIDTVKIGNSLKMQIICKDPRKAPSDILDLEICFVQPRHIPQYHKEALTHNEFSYDIDCYPPAYRIEIQDTEKKAIIDNQLEGQTNIFDFIGD